MVRRLLGVGWREDLLSLQPRNDLLNFGTHGSGGCFVLVLKRDRVGYSSRYFGEAVGFRSLSTQRTGPE